MEPDQVHPGLGHLGGKSRHKVQWLEDDVDGNVSIGGLRRVTGSAIVRQRQAFLQHRQPGDIAAELLQLTVSESRGYFLSIALAMVYNASSSGENRAGLLNFLV